MCSCTHPLPKKKIGTHLLCTKYTINLKKISEVPGYSSLCLYDLEYVICRSVNTSYRFFTDRHVPLLQYRARILVQVTIYRRLLIGRDGHLDQSSFFSRLPCLLRRDLTNTSAISSKARPPNKIYHLYVQNIYIKRDSYTVTKDAHSKVCLLTKQLVILKV